MTKKEKHNLKCWALWLICMTTRQLLAREVEAQAADNGSDNTSPGGNVSPKPIKAGTPKLRFESTLVYYQPTFKCYLIAIARLFKQALFHKKGEHFVLIA